MACGGWLLLVALGSAWAHTTQVSYSHLRLAGSTVHYTLAVSPHDLAVLAGLAGPQDPLVPLAAFQAAAARLEAALHQGVRVENDGQPCAPGPLRLDAAAYPQTLRLHTAYHCPAPLAYLTVTFTLFLAVDARHQNLGTLELPGRVEEFLLTAELPEFAIDLAALPRSAAARAWQFVRLGVAHIATGYDHLAFLLALLVAGGGLRSLVKIVSAFTVAHSLTLALATLGVLALPERLVEAGIALSIAYVAAENVLWRQGQRRWLVAFGFGLLHGLGFYGVLRAMALPRQGLALALLAFNLGVEAGQVGLVLLCYPALRYVTARPWHGQAVVALSLALLGLGLYWFVQRVWY